MLRHSPESHIAKRWITQPRRSFVLKSADRNDQNYVTDRLGFASGIHA
jgi:hypothetical protein